MIPFSGKTSLKQYVKGKPNPVGLKNFVLASTDGLILDFFIYQGANTWPDGKPDKYLGIGGRVVKKLSTHLNKGCEIYIDRYFTSIAILEYLLDKGIFATGTIQLNRVPKELRAKLSNDKALLKKGRGSFEEFIREDDKMCIVKWMDSRSVLIASTSSGSHPLQSARRWDKVGRKYINIDCPNAILRYNQCMGGVDLADRYVSYYRIAIRTKKWPLKVFWHFVDVAACNSWILYKRDKYACGENKKNIMDLLDFKFYIAECLIADATIDKEGESSSDIEYEPPTKKS